MSSSTACRVLQDLDGQVALAQVLALLSLHQPTPHLELDANHRFVEFQNWCPGWRLLVLAVLSAPSCFHLLAEVLQHICQLAELTV